MTTLIPTIFPLDPNAKLDFGFIWTNWLATDETISTSTWAATPAIGITLYDDAEANGITVVWLKDIVKDVIHRITNSIVTSAGREEDRSLYVKGIER